MTALARLREEQPRAVIGQRLRTKSPQERRDLDLSARHLKALCGEEHDPHYETVKTLARADHVIRCKVIVDMLPDDLALKVAHLEFDNWDDQIEFHKIVIQSIAGALR